MKAIFRATAILGSASVFSVLCGIISAKATAVFLGPAGFGLFALLQAIVNVGGLVATLGVATGLVRAGSRALAEDNADYEAALRRASWLISLASGSLAALLILLFRDALSEAMLGASNGGNRVALMGPALLLSLLNGVQNGALNARQRVGDLARITMISAALSLVPTITFVWLFREDGIAPALLANILLGWLVGFAFYRRAMPSAASTRGVPRKELVQAAGDLLRFGIPYTASMVVGAGVLMLVPVLILHALGPVEVGLFRAASALAVNYLGVLLAAMAQDYFPRVSSAADDPLLFNKLINDQFRLVLLVGGPAILAMLGAVPYLIPLLYSHKFDGAADLLEWQLIGDLFKFGTWTLSFVIMARLGSKLFLLTELAGGSMLLATSWFGMQLWGLPGLGIAFLVTGIFAFTLFWALLRYQIRLRWTRENMIFFLILAAAMAVVRLLPAIGLEAWRTPIAIALSAVVGLYSLRVIVREFGGWKWRRGPSAEEGEVRA